VKRKTFLLIFAGAAALWIALQAAPAIAVEQSSVISERWLTQTWSAEWCAHPDGPGRDPAAFLFRKTFDLTAVPKQFVIHASADQRYQLYVNGARVATGPARGDLLHWRYETVDIAPNLKTGKNVISARVWSEGDLAPWAQLGAHTAFILQGDGDIERVANTPSGWKVVRDAGWIPLPRQGSSVTGCVTGPNERIDASRHPWGWLEPGFDDSSWVEPVAVADGVPSGMRGDGSSLWKLVPRPIPLMEEKPERMQRVARTKRVDVAPGFIEGTAPVTVPAKTKATILLDRGVLTDAYPTLVASGGAGAKIRLSYEEGLFKSPEVEMWRLIKCNRDETKKCAIRQDYKFDEFLPDGGKNRIFSPLWWRPFRYIQIDIETAAEPLTIEDFYTIFTGYPFETRASFDSSDPSLRQIWEVGWRTARLCAGETYFDCPYYEQMQYAGDSRIQAMVSYYVPGDDRLARNAIDLLNDSRMPEGITQSRYPSRMSQVIPTFSIVWIGMIHDHWMYRKDDDFTRRFVWGWRSALDWFAQRRLENGLLGDLTWWEFVDWSWPGGVPPGATTKSGSSVVSLQFAIALREAADLEDAVGDPDFAKKYRKLAEDIVRAVRKTCWNEGRGLIADTPEQNTFSQHATVLAVLADVIPPEIRKQSMEKIFSDGSLAQCTLYFRYFLNQAAEKAGLGDRYLALLAPWMDILKTTGLTTWPETPTEPRSDCHAWSSGPTADLLSIVCGVKPGAPGFSSARIEPHLSGLEWVKCEVPHPAGPIRVSARMENGRLAADIELPPGLSGVFVSNGAETPLKPGKQTVGK
jgi:alpha-L-rhamnosidase